MLVYTFQVFKVFENTPSNVGPAKEGSVFLPSPITTRYLRMKNINGGPPSSQNAVLAKMDFMGMPLKNYDAKEKKLEDDYIVKRGLFATRSRKLLPKE